MSVQNGTLFVGEPNDSTIDIHVGAVHVYEFDGMTWARQATLYPGDGLRNTLFGESIDVFGNVMAVGGHCCPKSSNESCAGKVYIFESDGTQWQETSMLVPSDWGQGWWFGQSLDLEGDLLVVGASNWAGCVQFTGAAYVFRQTQYGWIEEARLCGSDALPGGNVGWAVSVVGRTLFVGAPFWDPDGQIPLLGKVYVFEEIGGVWTEVQTLRPDMSGPVDGYAFGHSLGG